MNAEEARKITNLCLTGDGIKDLLDMAYARICAAAQRGERCVSSPFYGCQTKFTSNQEKAALKKLEQDGYKVTHYSGDYRDPMEHDCDTVTWQEIK